MTNLKILFTVVATLAVFTFVANVIPQVQSAVPEEIVLSADMSPEELASIGEEVYAGVGGCTACHGLGTRAPDLVGVAGSVCAARVPGQSCKDYLWDSLVDPMAYIVDGFQPIMLDQSRTLTQPQLWTLVAYLESQGGEVTVTSDDFAAALAAADAAPAPMLPPAAVDPADIDPVQLVNEQGCLACHALGGEGGMVGPAFEDLIGQDRDYVLRGIVDPNADTAADFAAFAGTMPPTFGDLLSETELDVLVEFFVTGEVPSGGSDGGDGGDE
ncbi:MAG: c-type cytochrome [Gemmatimonadetes bacterium]|nr:c-type cytochrome [Gemmatimonadota bacterium]